MEEKITEGTAKVVIAIGIAAVGFVGGTIAYVHHKRRAKKKNSDERGTKELGEPVKSKTE